jgi:hypothetical protein
VLAPAAAGHKIKKPGLLEINPEKPGCESRYGILMAGEPR